MRKFSLRVLATSSLLQMIHEVLRCQLSNDYVTICNLWTLLLLFCWHELVGVLLLPELSRQIKRKISFFQTFFLIYIFYDFNNIFFHSHFVAFVYLCEQQCEESTKRWLITVDSSDDELEATFFFTFKDFQRQWTHCVFSCSSVVSHHRRASPRALSLALLFCF